ncbi:transposase [Spirosoma litoris]
MNRNGEPSKIVEILALPSQGQSVDEICRQYNISPATFYNWRQKYGGMDTEELRKIKTLQAENARLKKLLADKSLD